MAILAARMAGRLVASRVDSIKQVRHKGLVDLVTDVDLASEALIRATILQAFPDHLVLGEEQGQGIGNPRFRWIVDPLDGTTNFAHGFRFFCVSIGFEADGVMEVGAIYDPMCDELFLAQRGQGASLNGEAIHLSEKTVISECLLATGFPYDRNALPRALTAFAAFSTRAQAVRRAGSAALDLAYVASGRFDGYWEFIVRPWDVAAGALLVTEAGGTISSVDGSAFGVDRENIVASNSHVHRSILETLRALDR